MPIYLLYFLSKNLLLLLNLKFYQHNCYLQKCTYIKIYYSYIFVNSNYFDSFKFNNRIGFFVQKRIFIIKKKVYFQNKKVYLKIWVKLMLFYILQFRFFCQGWLSSVKMINVLYQTETTGISRLRINMFLSTRVLCGICVFESAVLAGVGGRLRQWSVIHAVISWNVSRKLGHILKARNVQDISTYTQSFSLKFASRPNIKCDSSFLVSAACNRFRSTEGVDRSGTLYVFSSAKNCWRYIFSCAKLIAQDLASFQFSAIMLRLHYPRPHSYDTLRT